MQKAFCCLSKKQQHGEPAVERRLLAITLQARLQDGYKGDTHLTCIGRAAVRIAKTHATAQQKLMWEALREAVDEEMEADPRVCLMGELMSQIFALHITLQTSNLPSIHARTPVLTLKFRSTGDMHRTRRLYAVCRRGCGTLWRIVQGVL